MRTLTLSLALLAWLLAPTGARADQGEAKATCVGFIEELKGRAEIKRDKNDTKPRVVENDAGIGARLYLGDMVHLSGIKSPAERKLVLRSGAKTRIITDSDFKVAEV